MPPNNANMREEDRMLDKIASTIRTCEVPKVIKINNIKYHHVSTNFVYLSTLESGINVGLRLFLIGFFTTVNKKSTFGHTRY